MKKKHLYMLSVAVIYLIALSFRMGGIFRGLEDGYVYHPDAAKQVMSYHNFMNDRDVWYLNDPFYDGYPLFLNHVDKWVSRPAIRLYEGVKRFVCADPAVGRNSYSPFADDFPNTFSMYYWVRMLRVFYSMLILLIAHLICSVCRMPRRYKLAVIFFMATSPLQLVISHAATGDIGVDLFSALAMLFVVLSARNGAMGWIFGAGIGTGFAFAAKYHGLMTGWIPGVFLSVFILRKPRKVKHFVIGCLLLLGGILGGILIAIPQFLTASKKTLKLILINFEFIKNYQVPPEILELSFFERALYGLKVNTGYIMGSLGEGLFVLGLISACYFGLCYLKKWKENRAPASRMLAAYVGIATFPMVALFLSLTGKTYVQPFHFACVQLPMMLGVVFFLSTASPLVSGVIRKLLNGALILVLLLPLPMLVREVDWWIKPDVGVYWAKYNGLLFNVAVTPEEDWGCVKEVNIEAENISTFRNRRGPLDLPHGAYWRSIHIAPVPSVPFPDDLYWIIMNGPVYPRNDRMFLVPRREAVQKELVFRTPPERLWLGVRTGLEPVQLSIYIGDEEILLTNAPADSQCVLELDAQQINCQLAGSSIEGADVRLPIRVYANGGMCWIYPMQTEMEKLYYEIFGGVAPLLPESLQFTDAKLLEKELYYVRYVEKTEESAPVLSNNTVYPLLSYFPLAAGKYNLVMQIECLSDNAELEVLQSKTFAGHDWTNTAAISPLLLNQGVSVITQSIEKAFAPYQYHIGLRTRSGEVRLLDWKFLPDAAAIIEDLELWKQSGTLPDWAAAGSQGGDELPALNQYNILFGKQFQLLDFEIPEEQPGGTRLNVSICMDVVRFPVEHLAEWVTFLHFVDAESRQQATGFYVYKAIDSCQKGRWVSCELPAPLSGDYELWLGIYNLRTGIRLPISASPDYPQGKEDDKICLGSFHFTENR